jgi:riboflavin synthase
MFTGLVQALGRIDGVADDAHGRWFAIDWPGATSGDAFSIGESIAINGCCLTVIAAKDTTFEVQAGPETLARSNLGQVGVGDCVNLERSLKAGDRLGGHFVQGHVDTTATLRERRPEGEWEFFAFQIDPHWFPLLVEKGSIAVDGVSLTIVQVWPEGFSVMLIPHTLVATTLGGLGVGDHVNIETDMIAKHIQALIARHK